MKSDNGYALGYTEYGEWTEYTINAEESSIYDITAYVSNGGKVDGFRLFIDDEEITEEYEIPQTGDNWSVYKEVPITMAKIEKGTHILKIVINGSYVNIDWLKFAKHTPSNIKEIVENSNIDTLKGAQFFDMEGRQININELQTGKVYIAISPDKHEEIKFIKK